MIDSSKGKAVVAGLTRRFTKGAKACGPAQDAPRRCGFSTSGALGIRSKTVQGTRRAVLGAKSSARGSSSVRVWRLF
jgi:hypothetical protein